MGDREKLLEFGSDGLQLRLIDVGEGDQNRAAGEQSCRGPAYV